MGVHAAIHDGRKARLACPVEGVCEKPGVRVETVGGRVGGVEGVGRGRKRNERSQDGLKNGAKLEQMGSHFGSDGVKRDTPR